MPESERTFVTDFVTRLVEERPRLLFFDRKDWKQVFGITDFDFERYFEADPRFAPLLASRYRWLRRVGSFDVYVLVSGS